MKLTSLLGQLSIVILAFVAAGDARASDDANSTIGEASLLFEEANTLEGNDRIKKLKEVNELLLHIETDHPNEIFADFIKQGRKVGPIDVGALRSELAQTSTEGPFNFEEQVAALENAHKRLVAAKLLKERFDTAKDFAILLAKFNTVEKLTQLTAKNSYFGPKLRDATLDYNTAGFQVLAGIYVDKFIEEPLRDALSDYMAENLAASTASTLGTMAEAIVSGGAVLPGYVFDQTALIVEASISLRETNIALVDQVYSGTKSSVDNMVRGELSFSSAKEQFDLTKKLAEDYVGLLDYSSSRDAANKMWIISQLARLKVQEGPETLPANSLLETLPTQLHILEMDAGATLPGQLSRAVYKSLADEVARAFNVRTWPFEWTKAKRLHAIGKKSSTFWKNQGATALLSQLETGTADLPSQNLQQSADAPTEEEPQTHRSPGSEQYGIAGADATSSVASFPSKIFGSKWSHENGCMEGEGWMDVTKLTEGSLVLFYGNSVEKLTVHSYDGQSFVGVDKRGAQISGEITEDIIFFSEESRSERTIFFRCDGQALPSDPAQEWTSAIAIEMNSIPGICFAAPSRSCLEESGAPEETIKFIEKRTIEGGNGPVVPVGFQELGKVDIAHLQTYSAAGTTYPYFVNTSPETITEPLYAETDLEAVASRGDPVARSILRQYPQAEVYYRFIGGMRATPDGGQRFSTVIPWTEICRACPIAGMHVAIVDFDANGRFRSFQVRGTLDVRPLGGKFRFELADVKRHPSLVQYFLNLRGYDAGPMDGAIGPRTRAALAEFQRENSINSGNGRLDERTLAALADSTTKFSNGVRANAGLVSEPIPVSEQEQTSLASSGVSVGQYEAPGASRWVLLASRKTLSEARELASRYEDTRIFHSENGWFAITGGLLEPTEPEYGLPELIRSQGWPDDAIMTKGSGFVQEVPLRAGDPTPEPEFYETETIRPTDRLIRSWKDGQPVYDTTDVIAEGTRLFVFSQPRNLEYLGDCMISNHEAEFVKCQDLKPLSDSAQRVPARQDVYAQFARDVALIYKIDAENVPASEVPSGDTASTLEDLRREPIRSFKFYGAGDGFSQTPTLLVNRRITPKKFHVLYQADVGKQTTIKSLKPSDPELRAVNDLTRETAKRLLSSAINGGRFVKYPEPLRFSIAEFNLKRFQDYASLVVRTNSSDLSSADLLFLEELDEDKRSKLDTAKILQFPILRELGAPHAFLGVTGHSEYHSQNTHRDKLLSVSLYSVKPEVTNEERVLIYGTLAVDEVVRIFQDENTAEVQFSMIDRMPTSIEALVKRARENGLTKGAFVHVLRSGEQDIRYFEDFSTNWTWTAYFRKYDDGWRIWSIK